MPLRQANLIADDARILKDAARELRRTISAGPGHAEMSRTVNIVRQRLQKLRLDTSVVAVQNGIDPNDHTRPNLRRLTEIGETLARLSNLLNEMSAAPADNRFGSGTRPQINSGAFPQKEATAQNPNPNRPSKLHVIIATDDFPEDIAADMIQNRNMIYYFIEMNVPQSRLHLIEIGGEVAKFGFDGTRLKPKKQSTPLTRRNILQTVASLGRGQNRVEPEDAVFFFYSGHGALDPATQKTYLSLSGEQLGLYVTTLNQAIAALNVRFYAVMVDCCNAVRHKVKPFEFPVPQGALPPEVKEVSPQFQKWFFNTRGSIVIESSAAMEYSITVPRVDSINRDTRKVVQRDFFGSLFPNCFLSAKKLADFEKRGKVFNPDDVSEPAEVVLDWPSICQRTQVQIDIKFQEYCPGGVILFANGQRVQQKRQTLMVLINGQPLQIQPPQ